MLLFEVSQAYIQSFLARLFPGIHIYEGKIQVVCKIVGRSISRFKPHSVKHSRFCIIIMKAIKIHTNVTKSYDTAMGVTVRAAWVTVTGRDSWQVRNPADR